jgi:hypothetical protein
VFRFLDVIPNKPLSQPSGLPGCKFDILEKQTMANGELGATLITGHGRHFDKIGNALAALPDPLGHPTGPLLLCLAEFYHRGSRG